MQLIYGLYLELGSVYSGSARPRAVKDRRPHTAPVTREPPAFIARGTIAAVRLSITELRTSRRPFLTFIVSVKNKNIRPISDRPFCFSAVGVITTGLKIAIYILNVENVTAATVFAVAKRDNKSCPVGLLLIICHM